MPDTSLDFRPQSQMDFNHVIKTLEQIHGNDSLRIIVERVDAEQTDRLLDLLTEKGFDFSLKSHEEDEYWIVAKRKH